MNIQNKALKVIKHFNSNSKLNFKTISKKLDISRQTLLNKIESLSQKNIINDYTININPNITPNLNYVILEIKTNPKEPYLVEELSKISQLKILDGIFGEFSLIALFVFKSSEEFNQILSQIDNIMSRSYFKKYQLTEIIKIFKTNGINLNQIKLNVDDKLDELDYEILKILQEDQGKKLLSTYEIKNMLKTEVSQSTIHNRIKKLENSGVILNYALNFCPKMLGIEGKYIVRIKPKNPAEYDALAYKLQENHYITDLFRIGEQYGLFAIIRVEKIQDYAIFIKSIYDIFEIEDTFTNFVLDELKPYTNYIIS